MASKQPHDKGRGNSRTLTASEQTMIAQYDIDHPDMTDQQIAKELGVTVAQVRYAREKADNGQLSVKRTGPNSKGRALAIMLEKDASDIMEEQLHYALGQIAADDDISPAIRITLLGSAARMHRSHQATKLVSHMKERDAELLKRIVRRFNPTASEEWCTQVYLEELALWQAGQDSH